MPWAQSRLLPLPSSVQSFIVKTNNRSRSCWPSSHCANLTPFKCTLESHSYRKVKRTHLVTRLFRHRTSSLETHIPRFRTTLLVIPHYPVLSRTIESSNSPC